MITVPTELTVETKAENLTNDTAVKGEVKCAGELEEKHLPQWGVAQVGFLKGVPDVKLKF